ncbi:hypothetical protein ACX12M_02730 [Cellulosimicrobium cellulans]
MELREWLPLAITGFVGLAGIVATLCVNLANLRAQARRDSNAAAEREASAKREVETARGAHLRDERVKAYADLVASTQKWATVIRRRLDVTTPGDLPGPPEDDDATIRAARDTGALVQLLAPPEVGTVVTDTLAAFHLADWESRTYEHDGRDRQTVWRAVNDMGDAGGALIRALRDDLAPTRTLT